MQRNRGWPVLFLLNPQDDRSRRTTTHLPRRPALRRSYPPVVAPNTQNSVDSSCCWRTVSLKADFVPSCSRRILRGRSTVIPPAGPPSSHHIDPSRPSRMCPTVFEPPPARLSCSAAWYPVHPHEMRESSPSAASGAAVGAVRRQSAADVRQRRCWCSSSFTDTCDREPDSRSEISQRNCPPCTMIPGPSPPLSLGATMLAFGSPPAQ